MANSADPDQLACRSQLIWSYTVCKCKIRVKWRMCLIWRFASSCRAFSQYLLDWLPGPSCSKLTMSLVNDSLKFTSVIRKYAEIFCWKNVSSFCSAKATHIFSAKNIRILCIESARTVNEMTLNELVKLTTLWTTGGPGCQILTFNTLPANLQHS